MYPVSLIQFYLEFQCNSLENDLETGNIFGILAFDGRRGGRGCINIFNLWCNEFISVHRKKRRLSERSLMEVCATGR